MLTLFISAFAVGLSGAIMPGPVMAYTIEKSLSVGRHAGLIIIIGHAILELCLIALIFLGFDVILQSAVAQIIIGLVGGSLLAYMGINMIYTAYKNKLAVEQAKARKFSNKLILSGVILSAINPYFIFWWAVVGLNFMMQSYDALGTLGVIIYYIGHVSADFALYGIISALVGSTQKFIQGKAYRIIVAILGAVMLFFGLRFFINAIISIFS